MTIKFSNNASTTLATDILANTTTISVTDASEFPDLPLSTDYFLVTIEDSGGNIEILKVTDINKVANSIGLDSVADRGYEGTTARAFTAGARIELRLTAGALVEVLDSANNAAQYNAATYAEDENTTANTYAVTYSPAITQLSDGMDLWFKPGASNTGASTLNVNGIGAKDIVFNNNTTLSTNVIITSTIAHVAYSSQFDKWFLQNPVLYSSGMTAGNVVMANSNNSISSSGVLVSTLFNNTTDLLPDITNAYDLGSPTKTFDKTYTNELNVGSQVTGTDFQFSASLTKITSTTTNLSVFSPYDRITISNTGDPNNSGSWTVASATTNTLVVETAGFVDENPGANVTITSFIPTTGVTNVIPNSYTASQLVQVGPVKDYIDTRIINRFVVLQYAVSSGSTGVTYTKNVWNKVPLNTERSDVGSICTLASNAFSLPVGTYHISWGANVRSADNDNAKFFESRIRRTNNTATTLAIGLMTHIGSNTNGTAVSVGEDVISISATDDTIELQVYTDRDCAALTGTSTSGENRIFGFVTLRRLS